MNLIRDPWIPVEHSDGRRERVAAVDIGDSKIARIVAPRRDFTGALYQLLIGLLQTYLPPRSTAEWNALYSEPPTRADLIAAFDPAPFELFSDPGKPAFMQDLDELNSKPFPIAGLIIDQPGAQGIKRNTDHFVHRAGIGGLCHSCVATALFALQTNAPAGGSGHRTGLRGGGPLTTLVFSDLEHPMLWKDLWLNVIIVEATQISENPLVPPSAIDGSVLPWLAATKTSKSNQSVSPGPEAGVHSLQAYWGMPRRIRLIAGDQGNRCDVCGTPHQPVVSEYATQNYGYNYSEAWRHPLTPYTVTNDGSSPANPKKGRPGALAYPDYQWITGMSQFGYSVTNDKAMVVPAEVVRDVQTHKRTELNSTAHLRTWVFGYDMKSMKPRGWMESRMPMYALPPQEMEKVAQAVRELVEVATKGEALLRKAVLDAAASDAKNVVGESSWADQVSGQFYSLTEHEFYLAVGSIAREPALAVGVRTVNSWVSLVGSMIERLFFESIGVAPDDRTPIDRAIYEIHSKMMGRFHGSKPVKSVRQRHALLEERSKEEVI